MGRPTSVEPHKLYLTKNLYTVFDELEFMITLLFLGLLSSWDLLLKRSFPWRNKSTPLRMSLEFTFLLFTGQSLFTSWVLKTMWHDKSSSRGILFKLLNFLLHDFFQDIGCFISLKKLFLSLQVWWPGIGPWDTCCNELVSEKLFSDLNMCAVSHWQTHAHKEK